jgi:hypothetical protein
MSNYNSPYGLEQDRCNFKRDHPELYEYIMFHEHWRIFDAAGDVIGHHPKASNTIWTLATEAKRHRDRLLDS